MTMIYPGQTFQDGRSQDQNRRTHRVLWAYYDVRVVTWRVSTRADGAGRSLQNLTSMTYVRSSISLQEKWLATDPGDIINLCHAGPAGAETKYYMAASLSVPSSNVQSRGCFCHVYISVMLTRVLSTRICRVNKFLASATRFIVVAGHEPRSFLQNVT